MVSIVGSPEIDGLCNPGPPDVTTFRRLEAEAQAREAEAKTLLAESERDAISASTSWRITRPLRDLKDIGLRVRDRDLDKANLHAYLTSTTKRCAAPPLRWLIARRRLRAVVDLYLPRFPALDRRVRAALHGVTANVDGPLRDPRDISLAARDVLRELYAARTRANSREGG